MNENGFRRNGKGNNNNIYKHRPIRGFFLSTKRAFFSPSLVSTHVEKFLKCFYPDLCFCKSFHPFPYSIFLLLHFSSVFCTNNGLFALFWLDNNSFLFGLIKIESLVHFISKSGQHLIKIVKIVNTDHVSDFFLLSNQKHLWPVVFQNTQKVNELI